MRATPPQKTMATSASFLPAIDASTAGPPGAQSRGNGSGGNNYSSLSNNQAGSQQYHQQQQSAAGAALQPSTFGKLPRPQVEAYTRQRDAVRLFFLAPHIHTYTHTCYDMTVFHVVTLYACMCVHRVRVMMDSAAIPLQQPDGMRAPHVGHPRSALFTRNHSHCFDATALVVVAVAVQSAAHHQQQQQARLVVPLLVCPLT